jgi:hypothetical protein
LVTGVQTCALPISIAVGKAYQFLAEPDGKRLDLNAEIAAGQEVAEFMDEDDKRDDEQKPKAAQGEVGNEFKHPCEPC